MNSTKIAISTFLIFSLLTIPILLDRTLAQTSEPQKQKAETLLNILETNNKTISTSFNKLLSQNISLPTAQELYQTGLTQSEEAYVLMNQKQYNQSCIIAILALQNFKATLEEIETTLSEKPTTTEISARKVIILKANITRTYDYVIRLENLTKKATSLGYNTGSIEKQLLEIKQSLKKSREELLSFNLDSAIENLVIAKTLLLDLTEPFSRLTNLVNEANTKNYLDNAETRISSIKTNITSSTLTPQIKEDAITALNNSELNLANARDMIEKNNIEEAIQELEEAKKWEEESKRITSLVDGTQNSDKMETLSSK